MGLFPQLGEIFLLGPVPTAGRNFHASRRSVPPTGLFPPTAEKGFRAYVYSHLGRISFLKHVHCLVGRRIPAISQTGGPTLKRLFPQLSISWDEFSFWGILWLCVNGSLGEESWRCHRRGKIARITSKVVVISLDNYVSLFENAKKLSCKLRYTVKKGFRFSRPLLGCH